MMAAQDFAAVDGLLNTLSKQVRWAATGRLTTREKGVCEALMAVKPGWIFWHTRCKLLREHIFLKR